MNKPNILFIMLDQQRLDCIGASGVRPVKTPNIDRLAEGGVFFEKALTPIPVCAPTRQSLISGRRPESFGGIWNDGIVFPVMALSKDDYAFPRELREQGYKTAFLGKWDVNKKVPPTEYGFCDYLPDSAVTSEIAKKYPDIEYKNGFFGDPCPVPLEESHTHVMADRVCEMIDNYSKEDSPWYIQVEYTEPHLPVRPSAPYDTMYKAEEVEPWGSFGDTYENKPYIQRQQLKSWRIEDRTWEEWSRTVALYYGLISQVDDAIGKIINAVDKTGKRNNTVIILTSDHGDMCGAHRMIDKHYNMYDDICRIPLIFNYEGTVSPCRYKGYVHHTLDMVPTILEIAGVDLTKDSEKRGLHGTSLKDQLFSGNHEYRDFAVSSYNGQQFGLYCERMIRTDKYKYVWNPTDIDEVYDLENDPYELKNIIYEIDREILKNLRLKLHDELKRCGDKLVNWTTAQLIDNDKI
ncbi:MAG: sulfatase-like hydrolase/transferase [Clostridia bacterium]|nr:sulfatase-like hydrolase/transferase [Clostridia bacterium]